MSRPRWAERTANRLLTCDCCGGGIAPGDSVIVHANGLDDTMPLLECHECARRAGR